MIPIYPPTHLIASDQNISVLPPSYRVKVRLDRRHLANADQDEINEDIRLSTQGTKDKVKKRFQM